MTLLTTTSRRNFVKKTSTVSASLAAGSGLSILTSRGANAFVNDPGDKKNVMFGFTEDLADPYTALAQGQLDAFKLAVEHINGEGDGGMLNTIKPLSLDGSGVNGKKVDYVFANTRAKGVVASARTRSMIEQGEAIMVTGGVNSDTQLAVKSLCEDIGVVHMVGQAVANDITGKQRSRHSFRHFFNSYMSSAALSTVLAGIHGKDRNVMHITADNLGGISTEEMMVKYTETIGWNTIGSELVNVKTKDFAPHIEAVLKTDADTLVLNLYGQNLVDAANAAVRFGLMEKSVNGQKFAVILPIYSRIVAESIGPYGKGLYGTCNWHWTLQDEGSKAFVMSYGSKYGTPPSMAAHTTYVQTLQYADACQRAGTFEPCAVIEALSDHQFSGGGTGESIYRGSDHQCIHDCLIVRTKENPVSEYDLLEVVKVVNGQTINYDDNNPWFSGDFESGHCG